MIQSVGQPEGESCSLDRVSLSFVIAALKIEAYRCVNDDMKDMVVAQTNVQRRMAGALEG